jgi:hypothetical protein
MLTLLISVGRFSVAMAAILITAATTVSGWFYGSVIDSAYLSEERAYPSNVDHLIYAAIGFLIGLILSGSIFGVAAAVFDIQRTLRTMARNQGLVENGPQDYVSTVPRGPRAEPRV